MERITGCMANEVLGRRAPVAMPFLAGMTEQMQEALLGRGSRVEDYAYEVPETGKSGCLEVEYFPLFAPGGRIFAGAAIVSDITEKKLAKTLQAESEHRFESMANFSPVMLWMAGTDGLCNFFNQTWLDFSGRTLEQEWGVGWSEMIHAEDFQFCMDTYLESFSRRKKFEMEYRLKRKDGEYRWILDRGTPRFGPDGTFAGYIGSCVDITERKQLENDLKQAVKVRDEFLSIASHELKTPLTSLNLQLGILDHVLKEGADAEVLAKRVRAVSELSHRQLSRLGRLIEDLLDVSKATGGKLVLDRQDTDLGGLVSSVLEQVAAQAKNSGCSLAFQPPETPVHGSWDRSRIEQVVVNLLANAFKYACGKPITVRVTTEGPFALLEVADQGPGIPPEERERIFEKFHRATASKSLGGLGLGLFIVKQIVERHHGTISVQSAAGEGAVFLVRLPLR